MTNIRALICLHYRTDVDAVVDEIARKEPLITASKTEQVRKLVQSRCSHIKTSQTSRTIFTK